MNRLEEEIIRVIAEESGVDQEEIEAASDLYSIGIDSLSALEILAALEKRYGITIPDHGLRNINSPMEMVSLISKELAKKGSLTGIFPLSKASNPLSKDTVINRSARTDVRKLPIGPYQKQA